MQLDIPDDKLHCIITVIITQKCRLEKYILFVGCLIYNLITIIPIELMIIISIIFIAKSLILLYGKIRQNTLFKLLYLFIIIKNTFKIHHIYKTPFRNSENVFIITPYLKTKLAIS